MDLTQRALLVKHLRLEMKVSSDSGELAPYMRASGRPRGRARLRKLLRPGNNHYPFYHDIPEGEGVNDVRAVARRRFYDGMQRRANSMGSPAAEYDRIMRRPASRPRRR
jgi:hypothetical protein